MAKDLRSSGRLKATLDDMKRKLEEDREAAELLTRHLTVQRAQKVPMGPSRMNQLETDLAEARKQMLEQKETTEKWIQQVTTERDAGRGRLREAEASMQKLRDELAASQNQLKEQREAAESLIQQMMADSKGTVAQAGGDLEARSRAREVEEDLQKARQQLGALEARVRASEEELAAVRQQFSEQKQASEEAIRQLMTERDESRGRLSEAEARVRGSEEELAAARQQLSEQKQASEESIQQLTAERDESRAQYSEVESRTEVLQEEFAAAHEQFREQRETAVRVIQQLEAERDESQGRSSELEAKAAELEKELEAARAQLQNESGRDTVSQGVRIELLDAVMEMQIQGQKLLDILQTWNSKAADSSTETSGTGETISDTPGATGLHRSAKQPVW
jgi:DNA repair exonuclease SbcCD ATPase subunit